MKFDKDLFRRGSKMSICIEIRKLEDIPDWTEKVKNSIEGTLFQYDWYLKIKHVKDVLCAVDGGKIVCMMPLIKNMSSGESVLNQSTIYVPYGGPVFLKNDMKYRAKKVYNRKVIQEICVYLQNTYEEVHFSTDVLLTDIVTFIRNGFIPEVRYTTVIDMKEANECNVGEWSNNRRRDLKKAEKGGLTYILDKDFAYFDFVEAVKWDNYMDDVEEYDAVENASIFMKKAVKEGAGMPFIAMYQGKPIGGVFIAWDHRKAYVLYSYYTTDRQSEMGVITYLYKQVFEYAKNVLGFHEIDLEGSVLEGVETFNISFAAQQQIYYNLHWYKDETKFRTTYYDYE